jgi:hypothetical protein
MGPRDFEVEQSAEFCAFLSLKDSLIGAAELHEIFLRQIDATLGCVCPDVS